MLILPDLQGQWETASDMAMDAPCVCIQRCPTFGPRVSLTARYGIKDLRGCRMDGTPGVFSGACKIDKKTLSEDVREELNEKGVVILPVPGEDTML